MTFFRSSFSLFLLFVLSIQAWPIADTLMISDIGSSAGMIGIANISGFMQNSSCIFDNPAGLNGVKNREISLFSTQFMDEIGYTNLASAFHFDLGTIGIGYYTQGINGLYQTIENPNTNQFEVINEFEYKKDLFILAYQIQPFSFLSIGSSLKWINESFSIAETTGKGWNMDFGLIVGNSTWDASLVAKNIIVNSNIAFENGTSENQPYQLILGLRFQGPYTILGQIQQIEHHSSLLKSMAFKTDLMKNRLSVSIGYKEFFVLNTIQSTITLGTVLSIPPFAFQYSYEPNDHFDFKHKHYYSIGINF